MSYLSKRARARVLKSTDYQLIRARLGIYLRASIHSSHACNLVKCFPRPNLYEVKMPPRPAASANHGTPRRAVRGGARTSHGSLVESR